MDRLNDFVSVGEDAVAALLQAYDLGELRTLMRCSQGLINSNYEVHTSRGAFLLRIYSPARSLPEVHVELHILRALATCNFPSPRTMPRRDRALVSPIHGRWCVVLSFLPGKSLSGRRPRAQMAAQIGAAVATMQNAIGQLVLPDAKPNADVGFVADLVKRAIEDLQGSPSFSVALDIFRDELTRSRP